MLALNVSCSVCQATFKQSDSIYSTSCGHIYHFFCMNQWRSKSNSCPLCRAYNPTSHVVYLNFESDRDYENVVNDLNAKLETSNGKIKKLEEEKEKKDGKIDDIKRLYNISEQWRAELEDKIHKLRHEQEQQNESHSKEIQSHKTHIETLEKEKGVEMLYEKINEFSTENSKLKKSIKDSETLKIILNHKIESQEQRLKHVTSELQKQFSEGLNHDIKQESRENINLLPSQKQTESNRRMKNRSNENRKIKDSRKLSVEERNTRDMSTKNAHVNHSLRQSKENRQFQLAQPNDYRIIIVNFPKNNIVQPLEENVISLASKMSISLTAADILKVIIMDPRNISNQISLTVEFKTIDKKVLFLMNRNRLRSDPSTNSLKIKEYIDEAIYPVFMYANRKLRGNGYEFICCKDNKVIAKKNMTDSEEIVIRNQAHVELLLSSQRTGARSSWLINKQARRDSLFTSQSTSARSSNLINNQARLDSLLTSQSTSARSTRDIGYDYNNIHHDLTDIVERQRDRLDSLLTSQSTSARSSNLINNQARLDSLLTSQSTSARSTRDIGYDYNNIDHDLADIVERHRERQNGDNCTVS